MGRIDKVSKKKKKMSKKGVMELIAIPIILLFCLFIIWTGLYIFQNIKLDIAGDDHSTGAMTALEETESSLKVWNWGFIFIVLALFIAVCFAAYQLRSHTAYLVFGFLVIIFLIIISGALANVWEEFSTSDAELQNITDSYPAPQKTYLGLPLMLAGLATLVGIILYGKYRADRLQ